MEPTRPPLPRLPLRAWLVVSHGAVLILPIAVILGSGSLNADLRNQTMWDLEHQGALLSMHAESLVRHAREQSPEAGLADLGGELGVQLARAKAETMSGIRITDPQGTVVATSGDELGEDLGGTPEVDDALAGRVGRMTRPRPAPSIAQPLRSESRRASVRLYVAMPIRVDDEVVGAVVLSRTPREELQALFHYMAPGVVGASLAALVSAVGLGVVAAWVATRSLTLLERGARRIAEADFEGMEELARPRRSHLTEVARTADAVVAMASRLRERLAYIGEFASHVSHEFKTPIATLKGSIELLTDDDDMSAVQRRRFLDNGAREVERLERLVSGLLDLARADEDRDRQVVQLQPMLEAVAARLGVQVTGRAGTVLGDLSQLDSVLTNLVENARRHGGEGVLVRIEATTTAHHTSLSVIDDGPGVSEANLPRIFERFFTTDRAGGGTGLGLALVRTIARRHGGDVTVESRPGRTCFSVVLPVVA